MIDQQAAIGGNYVRMIEFPAFRTKIFLIRVPLCPSCPRCQIFFFLGGGHDPPSSMASVPVNFPLIWSDHHAKYGCFCVLRDVGGPKNWSRCVSAPMTL